MAKKKKKGAKMRGPGPAGFRGPTKGEPKPTKKR